MVRQCQFRFRIANCSLMKFIELPRNLFRLRPHIDKHQGGAMLANQAI